MQDFLGFRPKYSILGSGALPPVIEKVMYNSVTIREGGAVQNEAGFIADLDAASQDVFGYCVGFRDRDGFSYDHKTANFGGTWTASSQGNSYAASSSNSDSGGNNVVALVIPAFGVVCSGYLSAAAAGTVGSNVAGYYLDILTSAEEQLDETSASTTAAQFQLMRGATARLATDPEHPESTRRVMVLATETEQANDV
uniref:Uncharacterized protein n=1 Tax=viral metagenome TaxID=1070528 RepID=A0A6H1ZLE2_9ZZZZ